MRDTYTPHRTRNASPAPLQRECAGSRISLTLVTILLFWRSQCLFRK
jgi:hypothetical protein